MPLSLHPVEGPRPLDETATEIVAKALREYTQWNPAFEEHNVQQIVRALNTLLEGIENQEQYNLRTEGMRATITLLRSQILLDGEPYHANRFLMT